MSNRKRVLVCPLDWGLGHATRCIPLIRALLAENADVVIAADGRPLALIKEEFSQLSFIRLSGYNIKYSKRMTMTLSMLLQSPKILFTILLEHKQLKKIIRDNKIDCVVSDNRYGLWNKNIYTVFITHQLSVKCPPSLKFFESFIYSMNRFFLKKFNACWIPDEAGDNNLSGALSHGVTMPANGSFIGLLSRFDKADTVESEKKYHIMAIVSGPEPHRSLFLKKMTEQLSALNLPSLIVAGDPQKNNDEMINNHIRLVSHLNSGKMKEAILQSEVIICRAGYSGIMDLIVLKKKAILIPTPGQTEQEYLGEYMMQKGLFYTVSQKDFKIENALKETNDLRYFSEISSEKKLVEVVRLMMQKLNLY